MSRLGERLKELRAGSPLQEVANALDIDRSDVSRYELGKRVPRPNMMRQLAEHFKVPYGELEALRLQDQFETSLDDPSVHPYLLAWAEKKLLPLINQHKGS